MQTVDFCTVLHASAFSAWRIPHLIQTIQKYWKHHQKIRQHCSLTHFCLWSDRSRFSPVSSVVRSIGVWATMTAAEMSWCACQSEQLCPQSWEMLRRLLKSVMQKCGRWSNHSVKSERDDAVEKQQVESTSVLECTQEPRSVLRSLVCYSWKSKSFLMFKLLPFLTCRGCCFHSLIFVHACVLCCCIYSYINKNLNNLSKPLTESKASLFFVSYEIFLLQRKFTKQQNIV